MDDAEVLSRCRLIITEAQREDSSIPTFDAINSFLDGSQLVADIVKSWSKKRREQETELLDFAKSLRTLRDDFEDRVAADPMMLYAPAHEVAFAFHSSPAFIRYFRGGNRTSKTQSGYAEHYFVSTGQHRWRNFLNPPTASFIIGVNFSKYEPNTFAKKFLTGEPSNPLSPMFPEGGKWFNAYDDRKHIVFIACARCAKANKEGSCKHLKSTITLFSDLEGPDVLQGGQYNLGHFDEHIREDFFAEAFQRLQTVEKSSFIVTGTPLHGTRAWEHRLLTSVYNRGPAKNKVPGTEQPYVSVHTIDQYTAGLIPHEKIEASKIGQDEAEIRSRIFGIPGALAKRSVFDRAAVHEMEQTMIRAPVAVELEGKWDGEVRVVKSDDGPVNIFEPPTLDGQYVIGCDVAQGLGREVGEDGKAKDSDYSCATVLKVPDLKVVAQYHGWINPVDFGTELTKLGKLYNMGWLVVERNGPGSGTIFTIRNLGYWNLFREVSDITQSEFVQDFVFGVDTNIRTKSTMVAYLQRAIKEKQITIPCGATIEELQAFGEELTPSGLNTRLRGVSGAHDDRVMSLVFAVYTALAYSLFDYSLPKAQNRENQEKREDPIWAGLNAELKRDTNMRKGKLW